MNEVYVSYNGTLYVPYIGGYVYWDVICSLHECITCDSNLVDGFVNRNSELLDELKTKIPCFIP